MDQSRALNALEPFLALAKSANSPRAASDLVTQATSAPNTYIFSELLQQPNIRALSNDERYSQFYKLLQLFSWGSWEDYKQAASDLPELSPPQQQKLRLLSLVTIASKSKSGTHESALSYGALMKRLDLSTVLELEQLVIAAIYSDLLAATLNPASQTVIVTSVAPLRDLAPGSVVAMIAELQAWSGRCDTVLIELENEITKVKEGAKRRNAREARAERQIRAVFDAAERSSSGASSLNKNHHAARAGKRDAVEGHDDGDVMDIDGRDGTSLGGAGKKRSTGNSGISGFFGRAGGKPGR